MTISQVADKALTVATADLLTNWLEPYTDEIVNKVLKKKEKILKDSTTFKLLGKLKEEEKKDRDNFSDRLQENIEHNIYFERPYLSNAKSIRDTLYVLWIKED